LPLAGNQASILNRYGPQQRSDITYFSFADAIRADRPLPFFDHREIRRDFA